MTGTINLGDNYTVEEDSNGDLLIKDSTGSVVFKHNDGGGLELKTSVDINDLVDETSNNTVYDTSTETVGDGTSIDGNFNSTTTDDATISNPPTGDNDALRWQEGAEVGTVTVSGADNSGGNDNWGQGANSSASTSFSNAFSATPKIGIAPDVDTANTWSLVDTYISGVLNKSTTGFDVRAETMAAADRTSGTIGVDYVASEGR